MFFRGKTGYFFILNYFRNTSRFVLRLRLKGKELNYSFKTKTYDNARSSQSLLRIIRSE